MDNEIKEILERIKTYPEKLYVLSEKEKRILLDYITNLQQENENLNKTLEEHDETLENTFNLVGQLILRIYKAIEYINNIIEDKSLTDFDCGSNNACNDLLNILQNGSDSQ